MKSKQKPDRLERGMSIERSTLNEEKRSVDITISTPTPIMERDYDSWDIMPTVIEQRGIQYPSQVPMLDTHNSRGIDNVLGSITNFRIEGGNLVGTATYSSTDKGDKAFRLMKEGHLTDYSLGARVESYEYRMENGVKTKYITKTSLMEVSNCPIGADAGAKTRASEVDEEAHKPEHKRKENMPEAAPTAPVLDEAVIRAQVEKETIARVSEVETICRTHGLDFNEFKGKSVDDASKAALARHAANLAPVKSSNIYVIPGGDAVDKHRNAAIDGITLRMFGEQKALKRGLVKESDLGTARSAARSLVDIARHCLELRGESTRDMSADSIIKRANSTSDFPKILANIANKSQMLGWEDAAAQESWSKFCNTGSVSDFKTNTRVRPSELVGDLQLTKEGEAHTYGSRTEKQEQFNVATYTLGYQVTRQLLINDDLGLLNDSFSALGEAHQRKIGDLAFDAFLLNAAMGDGTALFHANHKNSGTGAPSSASLQAALTKMSLQVDLGGKRRLQLAPKFLIAPSNQKWAWTELLDTPNWTDANSGSTRKNVVSNAISAENRIFDARLNAFESSDTALAWYLFAEARKTITVFFLNGNASPYLASEENYYTDVMDFKVRLDAGAKAMDWVGMYKSSGA